MNTTAKLPTTARRHIHFALPAALAAFAALALATPAQAAPKRELASAAAPAPASEASGVVNLNTASEEELQLLPGVGPSKAAAIIAYRKKYGAFKKVDDLSKVKGFSYKTLKKLKPYLALSGTTTYKGKARKSAHGGGGAEAPMTAEP
jgi:competence protein ComEA